jgi:hypothetical protein
LGPRGERLLYREHIGHAVPKRWRLRADACGELSWQRDSVTVASLAFRAEVDALVLVYLAEDIVASEVISSGSR